MKARIAVSGAAGKMGRNLLKGIIRSDWCDLAAALESPDSSFLGADAGELISVKDLGIFVRSGFEGIAQNCDVLIDFSTPLASLENVRVCLGQSVPLVIGTTGFSRAEETQLTIASKSIPICLAANYSVGVNLCFDLLERTSEVLGKEADIEIIESHHRDKIDAPSGTALAMAGLIAGVLDQDLNEIAEYSRVGNIGPRDRETIGFSVVRAGDIVGEHKVIFAIGKEVLEITHRANSREAFTLGALKAARWIIGKSPSLYSMRDVIARSAEVA